MIAQIRGFCMGGGLGIAMSTDIRIASDDSQFGIPAAKLGIAYGFDMVRALVDLVGPAHAHMILMTGERFDAREAERFGLVNKVVPVAELDGTVAKLAATMASNAPLSLHQQETVKSVLKDARRSRHGGDPRRHGRLLRQRRLPVKAAAPSWKSASRPSPAADGTAHGPVSSFARKSRCMKRPASLGCRAAVTGSAKNGRDPRALHWPAGPSAAAMTSGTRGLKTGHGRKYRGDAAVVQPAGSL